MQRFGEKLRSLRLQHGISQQQLADQFGFTKYYASALETGRKKPSLELVIKIADLFGVTVDQLVRDEREVVE